MYQLFEKDGLRTKSKDKHARKVGRLNGKRMESEGGSCTALIAFTTSFDKLESVNGSVLAGWEESDHFVSSSKNLRGSVNGCDVCM